MRTNIKKIFALLLTVALVATMFIVPTNAATKTYADYLDDNVLNGDFEIGRNGMNPYGWGLYSITNAWKFTTTDYSKSFEFETVMDNGNKVAQIKKVAAGYITMGSRKVAALAGQEYNFSFDYKIVETKHTPLENCSFAICAEGCTFVNHWHGISVIMREYDAEGNLLDTDGNVTTDETYRRSVFCKDRANSLAYEEMSEYDNASFSVVTTKNTAFVELYIGFGAYGGNTFATVNFDNVKFQRVVYANVLLNNDFEDITTTADAGRAEGTNGPLGWTVLGTESDGLQFKNSYTNNYKLTTGSERVNVTRGGETVEITNNYAQFQLIDAAANSTAAYTKGYAMAVSNKMTIPVAAGGSFSVTYKFKSHAAVDEYTPSTTWTPSFRVTFYDANGQAIGLYYDEANSRWKYNGDSKGRHTSNFTSATAVGDWTNYTLNVNAPAESWNAAYFTISFWMGGQRSNDPIDAVYCFDDILVKYTVPDKHADNDWTEASVNASGVPNSSSSPNAYSLNNVYDAERGEVIRITGTDRTSTQKASGYVIYYSDEIINIEKGESIVASFDYKVENFAYAERQHYINGGTTSGKIFKNAVVPQILFHYYDKDDNYLGKDSVKGASVTDIDWSTKEGKVTVNLDNVAYAKWGMAIFSGAPIGSALIEHYYDNVVVKAENDPYWTSDGYLNGISTNLFGKVVLAGGDANADETVDLKDLVNVNNKFTGKTYSEVADMNKNGKIDNEDITLLRWKLLGIDSESALNGVTSGVLAKQLKGKTAIFFGDSITHAEKSWAYQIHKEFGALTTNAGVSGASLSTIRPTNRIITQLENNKNSKYDYVILHGGVNDAWSKADVGTVSDSFDVADFDIDTYAGGLEEVIYYANKYFPDAKIGYIINYATPLSKNGYCNDMSDYFTVGKQICEKWNIPYIDLYWGNIPGTDISYSYDLLEMDKGTYGITGPTDVHINVEGYEKVSPYIADWMATIKTNKMPYVSYATDFNYESATEGLNIYVPATVGYVKYSIIHSVNANANADNWRLSRAYAVDDSFSNERQLTKEGAEWDMALMIDGRSDFIGGSVHGDEVMTSIKFMLDGKEVTDLSTLSSLTKFTTLQIVQTSNGYDPNDSTTVALTHAKTHTVTADGITTEQTVEWKGDYALKNCFLAMMPPLKEYTDHYKLNGAEIGSPIEYGFYSKVTSAVVYGEESGVSFEMSISEYPYYNNGRTFRMTDNGGLSYNKMYYYCCDDLSITSGTVWESTTHHSIDVTK